MGTNINNESFSLYAQPSFLQGVATLVDVSGSLLEYNTSQSEAEADAKALRSDWKTVGLDLLRAIRVYDESTDHGNQSKSAT